MKSTEQLERETEEARTRVAHRIDELRARATPGQVVDQLIDYARASDSGQFVDNLRRQIVANPLPVLLLGTSVAWLAVARTNGSMRAAPADMRSAAKQTGESIGDAVHAVRGGAEQMAESAGDGPDAVRGHADHIAESARAVADEAQAGVENMTEAASEALDGIRERVGDAYASAASRIRDVAASVQHAAPKLRADVTSAGQSFIALCREQPIVLAGIGLAIGATIGALLPQTSAENRLVGSASDDLKARARRLSAKATDAATSVYARAKDATGDAATPQPEAAADESKSAEFGHA